MAERQNGYYAAMRQKFNKKGYEKWKREEDNRRRLIGKHKGMWGIGCQPRDQMSHRLQPIGVTMEASLVKQVQVSGRRRIR
jgi:hypothetical protein